ncbi:MAG: Methionyl-tRNA synthetase [Parcubacteria bacterium C7867-006]|nr:MAG: Methionyl-tRNA synthetase [Parcubacteria bacterium C7867-006]
MDKNFYITTTLPYVNSDPHVGFAMELVRADIIARSKKLQGYNVFFNTGTDEHGQKLFTAAKDAGRDVKEYVDSYAEAFKSLPKALGVLEDIHFIRTTDSHHEKAAQEFWRRCFDNGYIYKKNYTTKYCVGCELEKTDSELVDGKCPLHPKLEIELRDEENYFFKFSDFGDKLLEFYKSNPNFVVPDFRFNEIKAFVERGLEDFSISRLKEKMSWGIPVPGDDNHVMYVWFDALVNYISTLGWPENMDQFEKFWKNGAPVQYCGKDNLRQQSAMWQAMLMAADLPNTSTVVVNGFLTGDGGVKMSKSLGNTINPIDVVNEYGADAFRFFVAKEVSNFEDSPFTMERFKESYNSGLANGIGNLTSRVMKMASANLTEPVSISFDLEKLSSFFQHLNSFEILKAVDLIWLNIGEMDSFIQENQPFKLIKTDKESGERMIRELVTRLYGVAKMLEVVMPDTSSSILELIKENKTPETPLFVRKD